MHLAQGKVVTDIQLFLVDTFTNKVFHGQPVAVCLLNEELNDELLHAIAIENQQPITAFILQIECRWYIRCFGAKGEMHISGPGLFAAAHVVFYGLRGKADAIDFQTELGPMTVWRHQEKMSLNIPKMAFPLREGPQEILAYVKPLPKSFHYLGTNLVLFYEQFTDVEQAVVACERFKHEVKGALVLTAPGQESDVYLRCFYPKSVPCEEIITLGVYPALAGYWSDILNQKEVYIHQGLMRRGDIYCEIKEDTIKVSCECYCYFKGQLML